MNSKEKIHDLIQRISDELLKFIKDKEPSYTDEWVPAAYIRKELDISFAAVPLANEKQYGKHCWFFATIARRLEDENRVEYKKVNGLAYYRTKQIR